MATTTTSTVQSMPGIGTQFLASNSANSSSPTGSALNEQDFLTLFTAQLQNQDPTSPMKSYQLASQLAQFTTVEQLTQATSQLNNIEQYSGAINNGEITSLVGKNVTVQDSTINVSSGNVANSLNYTLSTPSTVTYTIEDSSGDTVYTGSLGTQNAGAYNVPWTGKDSSGASVADGAYTCTVTATPTDGSSAAAAVPTTIEGQVYACNLNANPPTYQLSGPTGMQIPVSSVTGVSSN